MKDDSDDKDDVFHATVALFALYAIMIFAWVSCGCEQHDTSYWITEHGYEITHIDPGIDPDLAMVELDAGIEAWLVEHGQEYRGDARDLEFVIHNGWFFTILGMNATGSYVSNVSRVDLAWMSKGDVPPYIPALGHELEHALLGMTHP